MKLLPLLSALLLPLALEAAPVKLVPEAPQTVKSGNGGAVMIDFGKVAFGNLKLTPPKGMSGSIQVRLGEALQGEKIDRKPPGTVRYAAVTVNVKEGEPIVIAPPADARNTKQPEAILTPAEWGVVMPFRWVEIDGWKGTFKAEYIQRQAGYLAAWDDQAASFECSDPMVNRIWQLCRDTIKATSFAGIYVDGDRERIPYEADAYLNQLSHYYTDKDIQMARDSFEHLMQHPTWPSEWAPHMVFMAYADWMQTGDKAFLEKHYEALKGKMLMDRVQADGWVHSDKKQQSWNDIIDWPQAERDGFEFREVNTVINAFHLAALGKMAKLAGAIGNTADALDFKTKLAAGTEGMKTTLYIPAKGAYRDGIGTEHTSSHASFFPLAFGLVPESDRAAVTQFLVKKGMTCSVYGAQYLLESLFENGADQDAMKLITASGDRSWKHMVESGTTLTWEAWDQKYKPNQDWNHAWGAAPANLFPRYILGVQPLMPGCKELLIRPCPAGLTMAKGKIPTPQGPVSIHWVRNQAFNLKVELPKNTSARVELPFAQPGAKVLVDGHEAPTIREGDRYVLKNLVIGSAVITIK
jgi:alpha-L-rhamnosidase